MRRRGDRGVSSRERGFAGVLAAVGRAAGEVGLPVFVVGGALRDFLLRRSSVDLDIAAEGPANRALDLATRLSALSGWSLVATHGRFGTATLAAPEGLRVDLAATRTEAYPHPASLPIVTAGARIEEDLSRRDFTIHAMARGVAVDGSLGRILDPFAGREDLERRVLKLLHARSLIDDPTRAFRAVRYAVRLGFEIDPRVSHQLRAAREVGAFGILSGDRLRRALEEVLAEWDFSKAKELLLKYRLLDDVCPGWVEVLQREISLKGGEREREPERGGEAAGRVVARRWASLLSALSPSKKMGVAERLKFSRALRRSVGVPLR
jgi:tRNA nucleotidyltransferase (CCA-adding enzyme)